MYRITKTFDVDRLGKTYNKDTLSNLRDLNEEEKEFIVEEMKWAVEYDSGEKKNKKENGGKAETFKEMEAPQEVEEIEEEEIEKFEGET